MKNLLIILLAIYCFASLAEAASESENILGYVATKTGVAFQVTSGGCTKPDDFTTELNHNQVAEVTLIRIRPDTCYSFIPTGVKIKIPYEKIGIQPGQAFLIKNSNGIVRGWNWKDLDN